MCPSRMALVLALSSSLRHIVYDERSESEWDVVSMVLEKCAFQLITSGLNASYLFVGPSTSSLLFTVVRMSALFFSTFTLFILLRTRQKQLGLVTAL